MLLSTTPDLINGSFELLGALAVGQSIRKVLKDKAVAGVSWIHIAFFTGWGLWNMYYYPSLNQWASFAGGVFVAAANVSYLMLLIHFTVWPREDFWPDEPEEPKKKPSMPVPHRTSS